MGDMDISRWDLVDMEALCASLIDQVCDGLHEDLIVSYVCYQGYVQGYLLHSRSCLVVQKGNTLGFPPVSSVFARNEDS